MTTSTPGPTQVPRHYLMCRPTYFTVSYEINPWMDRARPVDTALAVSQWERLRDVYLDLGMAALRDALTQLAADR